MGSSSRFLLLAVGGDQKCMQRFQVCFSGKPPVKVSHRSGRHGARLCVRSRGLQTRQVYRHRSAYVQLRDSHLWYLARLLRLPTQPPLRPFFLFTSGVVQFLFCFHPCFYSRFIFNYFSTPFFIHVLIFYPRLERNRWRARRRFGLRGPGEAQGWGFSWASTWTHGLYREDTTSPGWRDALDRLRRR